MQFKKDFVPLILSGQKTQTRRLKKSWYAPGKIVPAQCGYREKAFARLRILRVWKCFLRETKLSEAKAEGFKSIIGFLRKFQSINNTEDLYRGEVWAIEFEVVKP